MQEKKQNRNLYDTDWDNRWGEGFTLLNPNDNTWCFLCRDTRHEENTFVRYNKLWSNRKIHLVGL
ncbi:hypothetical protein EBU94_07720 [bacterium]|nr:hypothetical protein [bacterium]